MRPMAPGDAITKDATRLFLIRIFNDLYSLLPNDTKLFVLDLWMECFDYSS